MPFAFFAPFDLPWKAHTRVLGCSCTVIGFCCRIFSQISIHGNETGEIKSANSINVDHSALCTHFTANYKFHIAIFFFMNSKPIARQWQESSWKITSLKNEISRLETANRLFFVKIFPCRGIVGGISRKSEHDARPESQTFNNLNISN